MLLCLVPCLLVLGCDGDPDSGAPSTPTPADTAIPPGGGTPPPGSADPSGSWVGSCDGSTETVAVLWTLGLDLALEGTRLEATGVVEIETTPDGGSTNVTGPDPVAGIGGLDGPLVEVSLHQSETPGQGAYLGVLRTTVSGSEMTGELERTIGELWPCSFSR